MEITELFEAVNAPDLDLYHWTDETALQLMMMTNIVLARTEIKLGGDRLSGKTDPTDYNFGSTGLQKWRAEPDSRRINGISMSRNQWLYLPATYHEGGFKPFRIGFNRRRLAADHRIIPYRDWYLRRHPIARTQIDPVTKRRVVPDESEEFVIGNIRPFWHYVDEIAIEKGAFEGSQAGMARYLIGGYLNKSEYAQTGLERNVNKSNIPSHVRMSIIVRKTKRVVPVEQFFGIQPRDMSARDPLPSNANLEIPRSARSSKDVAWNDKDKLRDLEITSRNYVDWSREDRKKRRA